MMRKWLQATSGAALLNLAAVSAPHAFNAGNIEVQQSKWIRPVAGSCKQVSSCEEAVQMWCGGYKRADGDGDGIPCENVCSSIEEVDQIRQQISC